MYLVPKVLIQYCCDTPNIKAESLPFKNILIASFFKFVIVVYGGKITKNVSLSNYLDIIVN